VLLTLLDLSAAFNTISHKILLKRLETEFGVCDSALGWIQSYLSGRSQSIVIDGARSRAHPLDCGLPQGYLVGPFCFPRYSHHIGQIARKHGISVHLYADDTQLYLAFCPDEGETAVDQMMDCIIEIRDWMEANMLRLNDSKTEFMVLASRHLERKLSGEVKAIRVGDAVVEASESARNIGVIMDSRLSMEAHINQVTSSCYFNLRNIGKIRRNLTEEATITLVQALVVSKLDSLNAILYGVPDKLIRKLQLVQNHAARVIVRIKRNDHITPTLKNLHWLPFPYRIDYKINLMTFKCLHGVAPSYLCELIEEYVPTRSLRSSTKGYLKEKKARCKTYGERAFSVCAPKLWNKLPQEVREKGTVDTFKKALKTHYFKLAYKC